MELARTDLERANELTKGKDRSIAAALRECVQAQAAAEKEAQRLYAKMLGKRHDGDTLAQS